MNLNNTSSLNEVYNVIKGIFSGDTPEEIARVQKMESRYDNLESVNMNSRITEKASSGDIHHAPPSKEVNTRK